MEASGWNGQAVGDEATAAEVRLPVDDGDALEGAFPPVVLPVDEGDALERARPPVVLPVDEGDARGRGGGRRCDMTTEDG